MKVQDLGFRIQKRHYAQRGGASTKRSAAILAAAFNLPTKFGMFLTQFPQRRAAARMAALRHRRKKPSRLENHLEGVVAGDGTVAPTSFALARPPKVALDLRRAG